MPKITKAEALQLFGIDFDNLHKSDWVHFSKREDIIKDDTGGPARGRSTLADRIADRKRRAFEALLAALSEVESAKHPDQSLEDDTAAGDIVHGPKLKKEHPMLDVLEVISIVEEGLMAQAKLSKRDGETDAQAFSRKYASDIEFRKQDRTITEAKQLMVAAKSGNYPNLMSLEPRTRGGPDALAVNNPVKALADYEALVADQHKRAGGTKSQAYEAVNRNPEYKVIVDAVFRRPDGSSPSGDRLQDSHPGRG